MTLQANSQGHSFIVLSKSHGNISMLVTNCPLRRLHIPGRDCGCHWQAQEKHERGQEGRVVPDLWGSTTESPLSCYLALKLSHIALDFPLCLSLVLSDHGELPLQGPESRECWGDMPGCSWQGIQQGSWLEREQYSPCRHSGENRGRM